MMIYLDYSATTPVNPKVLDSFNKACNNYIGNPNSHHRLGIEAKELINEATNQIANLLKVKANEIIYTSGATEANNLAIKGVLKFYQKRGNHIITTNLEHSSVKAPLDYLKTKGYQVSYVNLLTNGLIDINHLKSLINNDTILISICYVDSELGIKQPIEEIALLLKKYPKVIFHVDATQALGKIKVNLNNIDLVTFSAHKFYGLKGIGCLICKEKIKLEPLCHGGQSINLYRSGTPSLPLIVSLSKALRLSLENIDYQYQLVNKLNNKIKSSFLKINNLVINSTNQSIPHILNISLLTIKPSTLVNALSDENIFVSTKSACLDIKQPSIPLLTLTKNELIAKTSIRISLSYLTTDQEIKKFLEVFNNIYQALNLKEKE